MRAAVDASGVGPLFFTVVGCVWGRIGWQCWEDLSWSGLTAQQYAKRVSASCTVGFGSCSCVGFLALDRVSSHCCGGQMIDSRSQQVPGSTLTSHRQLPLTANYEV